MRLAVRERAIKLLPSAYCVLRIAYCVFIIKLLLTIKVSPCPSTSSGTVSKGAAGGSLRVTANRTVLGLAILRGYRDVEQKGFQNKRQKDAQNRFQKSPKRISF